MGRRNVTRDVIIIPRVVARCRWETKMMMMIVWLRIMPFSTLTDRRFYECCIATRESREDVPDGLGWGRLKMAMITTDVGAVTRYSTV
jgi:hypothetical protein